MKEKTPVNVNFNENTIVDAVLTLCKIKVDKDKLCTLDSQEINDLATIIIMQTCKSVIDSLKNETKGPHIISEFISRSNLKYLTRGLH